MIQTPIPLSLYIHLPWCIRKCPYCDFNSHESEGLLPEMDYVNALLTDLQHETARMNGRPIETLFIGGGTPSLFSAKSIRTLLNGVRNTLDLASNAEVTLEANPGASDVSRFEGYLKAGVNRLSIGAQSFQNSSLKALGRIHDREAALAAAKSARDAGFTELNLDLMFGLPEQTPSMAKADLETAIGLGPSHLSFYQLTLEPHTVFAKYPPPIPHEDAIFEIQTDGQALLKAEGFHQYEVSAYAKTGSRCRHNLNYWEFGDYIGIGAGAHGKITDPNTLKIHRSARMKHPGHYLEAIRAGKTSHTEEIICPEEAAFEFLMNGLRLLEGCSLETLKHRTGASLDRLEPLVQDLFEAGLLEGSGPSIRCSKQGYPFLDTILQRLLPP